MVRSKKAKKNSNKQKNSQTKPSGVNPPSVENTIKPVAAQKVDDQKYLLISQPLAQNIMDYLLRQPCGEVMAFVNELHKLNSVVFNQTKTDDKK